MKLFYVCVVLLLVLTGCSSPGGWRDASRQSAGLAPDPRVHSEAVIQAYAADAWGWRGWFAVHTWIASKRSGDQAYTVYDVVGWRQFRGSSVVGVYQDIPDRYWYGSKPELLLDLRGTEAEPLIDRIEAAASSYPWASEYSVFPGPNSNTFVSWVARSVPELQLRLPFSAIGSGFGNTYDSAAVDH